MNVIKQITAALMVVGAFALCLYQIEKHIEEKGYYRGVAETTAAVEATALAAQAKNEAVARQQIETLAKAQHEQQTRLRAALADNDRARSELDRLRIAAADYARGGDVPATTADASPQHGAAVSELLAQCGAELVSVARAADGHAADSMMLQAAWPR